MIGIQLYTLREAMAEDFFGVLEGVRKLGYDGVEFAGYGGYEAAEIKKMCGDQGLKIMSSHHGIENFANDASAAAEFHRELGVKYVAIPWLPVDSCPGGEKYEETKSAIFKAIGALNKAGIRLLYHNHDFEFETLPDGSLKYDRFFEDIPEMHTEIDTCWVKYAGYDPVRVIGQYRGRAPLIHLKDFVGKKGRGPAYDLIDKDGNPIGAEKEEEASFAFRPLGQGVQDIPALIRAGLAAGAEGFIVEQDDCYGDPWGAAEQSRVYLKSIGY